MWSNHFTMIKRETTTAMVSVQMRVGINYFNSVYNNEYDAIMDSYRRVNKHAWEICRMVEYERNKQ